MAIILGGDLGTPLCVDVAWIQTINLRTRTIDTPGKLNIAGLTAANIHVLELPPKMSISILADRGGGRKCTRIINSLPGVSTMNP